MRELRGRSPGEIARAVLTGPFRADTWRATLHQCLGFWLGAVSFAVMFGLMAASLPLLVLALAGVPVLVAALFVARGVAILESARAQVFLGEALPLREPPRVEGGVVAKGWSRLQWTGSWIEAGYAMVVLPITAFLHGTVVAAAWGGAFVFLAFPVYDWTLPDGDLLFGQDVGWAVTIPVHLLLGLLLLLAAPWIARASAAGTVSLARYVLSPNDRAELVERVEDLTESRSRLVDAADAERRRIERDLHDGAQQRLVAVAMTLGRARARMDDDPAAARRLMDEAHAEAKHALAELRDLARGLHPSVLTDRGLDAALSALAARSPVPVAVEIAPGLANGDRPGAATEAVAYFVVAEALTNVAKHAGATCAWVRADREGTVLRLEIGDDGRGGADPARGTGLAGLRDRVRAVDGTFEVDSPPGGPTEIRVGLPCAS